MTPEAIEAVIFGAIDHVNAQQPPGQQIEPSPETVLFGPGGALDSLGVISLVVQLEQDVAAATGDHIQLLDEEQLAAEDSPLRSVSTLAKHIALVLGDGQ